MIRFLPMLVLLPVLGWYSHAAAHESRPLYVEIKEVEPLIFTVQWKTPPGVPTQAEPSIALPAFCEIKTPVSGTRPAKGKQVFRCTEDVAGSEIRIDYPVFNPSVSTLTRTSWLSGESQTVLGAPDESVLRIPPRENFGNVAWEYLALGARHILEGYDHLLFLICLLIIARTPRRMLITITGFTVAHSITLALSTLNLVRAPVPPVEATIALSIVFLALEIVRGDANSLTYRHPIAVASTFGLLHGFGFATVLGETGLPQTEVPTALLFFNLGVEVGQVSFVLMIVAAYQLLRLGASVAGRSVSTESLRPLETTAAYAVGIIASFWMIERVAGFWQA
ncbi:MAG: HupE/UreJ family protein [Myxococcota bacterium]